MNEDANSKALPGEKLLNLVGDIFATAILAIGFTLIVYVLILQSTHKAPASPWLIACFLICSLFFFPFDDEDGDELCDDAVF